MRTIDFDAFPMLRTHCPICLKIDQISCGDINRCPLALAKFKGEFITPEAFASKYGVSITSPSVVVQRPAANSLGRLSLF